jgi:hypothetical protein
MANRGTEHMAAMASCRRADQRGNANAAFNLAILLEEQGAHPGALRAYQSAGQLGHPMIADMARAAALDLRRQIETRTVAGNRGGYESPGTAPSPWRPRPLLVLAASVLVLVSAPALASAQSPGAVEPKSPNTSAKQRGHPAAPSHPALKAAQKHRHLPALPVTLVLLGLAALGLATMSLSYARIRARPHEERANARPRGLQVKLVRLPPGWRAQTDSLDAEHEERE